MMGGMQEDGGKGDRAQLPSLTTPRSQSICKSGSRASPRLMRKRSRRWNTMLARSAAGSSRTARFQRSSHAASHSCPPRSGARARSLKACHDGGQETFLRQTVPQPRVAGPDWDQRQTPRREATEPPRDSLALSANSDARAGGCCDGEHKCPLAAPDSKSVHERLSKQRRATDAGSGTRAAAAQ